jgi:hypothetical protein
VHGVAEQRGQAEVVDRGQDRDAERRDKLEDLDLVADVEVVGRLVQDQVVGALRDGLGDQGPLLLAAGQRVEAAVREFRAADRARPNCPGPASSRSCKPAGRAS